LAIPTHELAEFTIHPDHRRQGIGTQAAYLVFNALGGEWTLGVVENSPGSMAFWEQCLAECEKRLRDYDRPAQNAASMWQLQF
jgi:predicted acetyltransferase